MSDDEYVAGEQTERERPSDAQLLERFSFCHDGEAFRQLVLRHERLVLGVCRRILWDEHDADDAFQATFIVLARKSCELRSEVNVGPWLLPWRTARRSERGPGG